MKVLAVKLRAIGDTVIWTSALTALRKAHPGAEIHVLTYKSNAGVMQGQDFVDVAHYLDSASRWELVRKLVRLRRERFDWLLGFHASTSLCRWAWLAGAGRVALHHHSWAWTPRGSVPIPEPGKLEDAISRDYQLLRAMGLEPAREPTRLMLSREEMERAQDEVRRAIEKQDGDLGLPKWMFLPGASHPLRRYPQDLWWTQVVKTRDEGKFQPVVLADEALFAEWDLEAACLKMKIPFLRGGSLREFMARIKCGERALANDSGPGHIAVALGVHTTFIFGPGCLGDWHCYDPKVHPILRVPNLACRLEGPRGRDEFQFCTISACAHHKCLREIRITL